MKRLLNSNRFFATAMMACALMVGVVACGEDAEEGQRDRGPADILNFPDGFGNVAHKCDGHGHRVYSAGATDAGTAIAVIDDPACERNVP